MILERWALKISVALGTTIMASLASAQGDLQAQKAALLVITETADKICNQSPPLVGSGETIELSGNAKAALNGAISRVVDLGVAGAGKYASDQYIGVLRSDLAKTIEGNTNCRLAVFNALNANLLGKAATSPSGTSIPSVPGQVEGIDEKEFSLAAGQSTFLTKDKVVMSVIGHPFGGNGPLMGIRVAGEVKPLFVGSKISIKYSQGICSLSLLELLNNGGGKFYLRC